MTAGDSFSAGGESAPSRCHGVRACLPFSSWNSTSAGFSWNCVPEAILVDSRKERLDGARWRQQMLNGLTWDILGLRNLESYLTVQENGSRDWGKGRSWFAPKFKAGSCLETDTRKDPSTRQKAWPSIRTRWRDILKERRPIETAQKRQWLFYKIMALPWTKDLSRLQLLSLPSYQPRETRLSTTTSWSRGSTDVTLRFVKWRMAPI